MHDDAHQRDRDQATPRLTARGQVAALLRKYGLSADKGFGQNFLVDDAALRAIVGAAGLRPGDTVFEVGPGLGVLTRALAAAGAEILSVELDTRLMPLLAETLEDLTERRGAGSVRLVHGDATTFDLSTLPAGGALVANLPYNVATAVLTRALASRRFRRLVFLVQREVAERLVAAPSAPAYGALSLLVAHYGKARIVRDVPPGAFWPPPKVTSSVVRIDVDEAAAPDPALFGLIHEAFAHRRKTLLRNLVYAGYDKDAAAATLAELGLDPRVRAEALDLAAFRRLRGALASHGASAREATSILR